MIILDTNVISELVRPHPEPGVLAWLDQYPMNEVYLTAVTTAELRYGAARLPDGPRRTDQTDLAHELRRTIEEDFVDRILPFDDEAASHFAQIVTSREAQGRPISMADAQIAAICRNYGAPLATRNANDFIHIDLSVVNPWNPRSAA